MHPEAAGEVIGVGKAAQESDLPHVRLAAEQARRTDTVVDVDTYFKRYGMENN